MRTLSAGTKVPETIQVLDLNTNTTTEYRFLAAGSFNVAYISRDQKYVCEVMQFELDPGWEKEESKLISLAKITDAVERNIRLWNTYMPPSLRLAKPCVVILADGRRVDSWLAPFLQHVGPPITHKEIERLVVKAIRGDTEQLIPGGRFIADIIAGGGGKSFGNAVRLADDSVVSFDFGAFFALKKTPPATLQCAYSQDSVDVWFEQLEPKTNYDRRHVFAHWYFYEFIRQEKCKKEMKSLAMLLAAIAFLQETKPWYTDLQLLLDPEKIQVRDSCAKLFFYKTNVIKLCGWEQEKFHNIINTVFPDLPNDPRFHNAEKWSYGEIIVAKNEYDRHLKEIKNHLKPQLIQLFNQLIAQTNKSIDELNELRQRSPTLFSNPDGIIFISETVYQLKKLVNPIRASCHDISSIQGISLQELFLSGKEIAEEVRPFVIRLMNLQAQLRGKTPTPQATESTSQPYILEDFEYQAPSRP